jgi:hypothetical protein
MRGLSARFGKGGTTRPSAGLALAIFIGARESQVWFKVSENDTGNRTCSRSNCPPFTGATCFLEGNEATRCAVSPQIGAKKHR